MYLPREKSIIVYYILDIDDCVGQTCSSMGTCTDLVDDYKCECNPGFTGKDCETSNYFLQNCHTIYALYSFQNTVNIKLREKNKRFMGLIALTYIPLKGIKGDY